MPRVDNKRFYTSAIKKYGENARGVNWNSKGTQTLRFDKILQLLPKSISDFTLVDAGCGFGDFYHYLKDKNICAKKYIGVDSLVEMQQIASKNTNEEIILANICKDTLPTANYYICSGALNILTPFETYQFIQNCYNSSTIGFIFNLLHGNKKSDTYNYLSTSKIEDIAKELNVGEVVFVEDYLQNDITIGFFR